MFVVNSVLPHLHHLSRAECMNGFRAALYVPHILPGSGGRLLAGPLYYKHLTLNRATAHE